MSCFKEGFSRVQLFNQQNSQQGLYENQIGAIASALAHFSTKKDPALITMPTGTGKTAANRPGIPRHHVLELRR